MLNPLLASSALLMVLAAPAAAPQPPPRDWDGAAHTLTQQMVIHVPQVTFTSRTTIITRSLPMPPPPPAAPMLVERKPKDCVKADTVLGYEWTRSDSIDLILTDGSRLRAKLGAGCPAIGFYGGFYVKRSPDGKMCAKRDSLLSRSGATCDIRQFRSLVPQR